MGQMPPPPPLHPFSHSYHINVMNKHDKADYKRRASSKRGARVPGVVEGLGQDRQARGGVQKGETWFHGFT